MITVNKIIYISEECGAYVIYLSTDYVFDGNDAPYEVDAKPNPLNAYGKTKLEGEKVTLDINKGKSSEAFSFYDFIWCLKMDLLSNIVIFIWQ